MSRCAAFVLLLALLAGCGDDASAPAVSPGPAAVENCGQRVEVPAPPKRAVAFSQPGGEIMLSLGLADRMAGTAYFGDPVLPRLRRAYESVPVLAKTYPSFERVLAAEPDFAYGSFASAFSGEGVATRDRFAKLGIPTYLSPSECVPQSDEQPRPLSEDDLFGEILDIARLFGVRERGERLVAGLRERLHRVRDNTDAGDVSLMWWYSNTSAPYVAGCCGAPALMTRAIGAKNAFGDNRKLWPEIGWEAILKRDPDVLVLADLTRGNDGDSAEVKIDFLERDPVARRLTAVRRKRYVVLSGSEMDPGVRNVDGVEKLAAGLRRLGV